VNLRENATKLCLILSARKKGQKTLGVLLSRGLALLDYGKEKGEKHGPEGGHTPFRGRARRRVRSGVHRSIASLKEIWGRPNGSGTTNKKYATATQAAGYISPIVK